MQASRDASGEWRADFSSSDTPSSSLGSSGRRDLLICLLLGLSFFLIYNANLRSVGAADTYSARYLPLSIWKHHSLTLDPVVSIAAQGRAIPPQKGRSNLAYWMIKAPTGNIVSLYPIVTPVVVAPLYLPAVAYLDAKGWHPHRVDYVARVMEKLSASLMTAMSAMLLYLLLRRRSPPATAVLLTTAYALGTTAWVVSSQALWMHGLGGLLVIVLLYLLTGPCTFRRALGAGLACALLACNRQPDAILAAGFALYAIRWAGPRFPLFVIAGAVPVGLVLAYNILVVGHILGGYGLMAGFDRHASQVGKDVLFGTGVMLFSPVYGLFVFSPFLLFVPLFLYSVLRDRDSRALTLLVGGALALQVLFYGATHWVQGQSWGGRYLTGAMPILVWMLSPVFQRLRAMGRALFIMACVAAVAIQAVGAFCYTGNALGLAVAANGPVNDKTSWEKAVWDIDNAPFVSEFKFGRVAPDLGAVAGNIDQAEIRDDGAGLRLVVSGWALVGGHTPLDVSLTVDGRVIGFANTFFHRPDVSQELGEPEASGWEASLPIEGLAPGGHAVSALVRAHSEGQQHLLASREFMIAHDPALAQAARRAAAILADRQDQAGYWLTEFSRGTQYVVQRRELNIFSNAALIELLAPVAGQSGLTDSVARARRFLGEQIEDTGLVRYHGRTELPTMGVAECRITPDADDTALAWRLAPSERPELLASALATLKQYRTQDGLYQTWLEPRERFFCIDPGKDPNPPDIGIQLHVYLWLAKVDPPAAHAHCEALQRREADESLWVYYRLAPPIVLLRLNDVSEAGCPLQLPQERLQTTIEGQEIWIELLDHLRHFESGSDHTPERSEAVDLLLRRLAADDFALLLRDPPLIYHNDLSATVSRYYWSEPLGYALWTRLYYENEHLRSAVLLNGQNSEEGHGRP